MSAITYVEKYPGRRSIHIGVYLDGRYVGVIKQTRLGKKVGGGTFYYTPKGSKNCGDLFPTLEACKKSLEAE